MKGMLEADSLQIAKNGVTVEEDSFSTFKIRRGNTTGKQFNVSKNVVYNFGTCLSTTLSRKSELSISYSNFIHNKCEEKMTIL